MAIGISPKSILILEINDVRFGVDMIKIALSFITRNISAR